MAQLIPPTPLNAPMNSDVWNRWLETVRQIINNSAVGVVWDNINFAGSNLSDLAVREHNTLQAIQGGSAGERYHLTSAQHTEAIATRSTRGVDTTDDVIVDDSVNGLVLKSPDGHYWRLQVSNTGVVSTTDLGTTKP